MDGSESDEQTSEDSSPDTADVLGGCNPAMLTIATICLKAAKHNFVSPFAWRIAVYNNSRGKVDTTRMMNRLLLSSSYSYQEAVGFAHGQSGVISSDNIQKQGTPSTASHDAQAKIVIVTSTIFRRIHAAADLQSNTLSWSLSDVRPPSKFMDLTDADRRKVLDFIRSDHEQNLVGSQTPSTKQTRLSTSRRTSVCNSTRVLPCINENPASEEAMGRLCDTYTRFLQDSGKRWIWVVVDGGPMMSFLKLQRQNQEKYNHLHPIIGGLHEEMCYLEALCLLLNAIGLLNPARRGR